MSEKKVAAQYCPYFPCGCVGYGYVPEQEMKCTYDACMALEAGSVFPELILGIDEYGKVCKYCGGGDNE